MEGREEAGRGRKGGRGGRRRARRGKKGEDGGREEAGTEKEAGREGEGREGVGVGVGSRALCLRTFSSTFSASQQGRYPHFHFAS